MSYEDEPKVSPFAAPFLSLFCRKPYISAAVRWRGMCALYTLGLVFVSWAAVIPKMNSEIGSFTSVAKEAVVKNLPAFKIKDGRLSCEAGMPLVFGDEKSGRVAAIVDTRIDDPGNSIKPDGYPFLVVTADRFVYLKSPLETRIGKFSDAPDMNVSKEAISSFAEKVSDLILPAALLFLVPLSYVGALVKILVVAGVVGVGAAVAMSKSWSFGQIYRISAVAVTPSLFFRTAVEVAGLGGGGLVAVIGMVLTVFFTVFGISSLERRENPST